MYDKLEKLKELKTKGVLSDAEFEVEKKNILNQNNNHQNQQAIKQTNIEKNVRVQSGTGIAGFVLALVANTYYLQPITVLIYGLIALIFSIIGVSQPKAKYYKGLAIAGLVIAILTILGSFILMWLNSNGVQRYYSEAISKYD